MQIENSKNMKTYEKNMLENMKKICQKTHSWHGRNGCGQALFETPRVCMTCCCFPGCPNYIKWFTTGCSRCYCWCELACSTFFISPGSLLANFVFEVFSFWVKFNLIPEMKPVSNIVYYYWVPYLSNCIIELVPPRKYLWNSRAKRQSLGWVR